MPHAEITITRTVVETVTVRVAADDVVPARVVSCRDARRSTLPPRPGVARCLPRSVLALAAGGEL